MQKDQIIQFRVDTKTKTDFQEICRKGGNSMTDKLRALMRETIEATSSKAEIDLVESQSNSRNKNEKLKSSAGSLSVISGEKDAENSSWVGELYCGPGGLGLAASMANISAENGIKFRCRHRWATDIDPFACETYRKNIFNGYHAGDHESEGPVLCKSVTDLRIDQLKPIDALLFGFPCNDFSAVGETKGLGGKFGPLYSYGVKVINQFNPKWFLAENVSGLSSANQGRAFQQILHDLENAGDRGYRLTAHLYKFEEYGVPQARHRMIIIGMRSDLGLTFQVPKPTYVRKSARQAIEEPAISPSALNNELTKQSKTVVERLNHIKPGQNAWNSDLPEHLKLNVKSARLSHIYKRLDPDKPSYTITGSGGGGTHVYHWEIPRALTNRERARLQTFPDSFEFCGPKESVRKQIGMAVPVDGGKQIIEAVLKTLAGVEYDSVKPSVGFFGENKLESDDLFSDLKIAGT